MMVISDLREVLGVLAKARPIFHSEADFKHALAWELQRRYSSGQLRLERHTLHGIHLDLDLSVDGERTAFELKYVPRTFSCVLSGERFEFRSNSAQDQRRYDFINDLARVERLVEAGFAQAGFVIVLTNDRGYWLESRKAEAIDTQFRLHQGRRLTGTFSWGEAAGAGTIKKREAALQLTGEYVSDWIDYSVVASGPGGAFRYLAVEVTRRVPNPNREVSA
jgi:hypothetical protein